jgi:maltose alpha-D-glucosyltransferase / alpha-amylase
MGDFAGLMQRLDYIQELGVTAIWLLPFYPSPLRDDGYDISDYRSVNPRYGQMRDLKAFLAEAHKRSLRVITELVINHTSDQHPWFQRARSAKPGSAARQFYLWNDTDEKFQGTRIIFLDTEKSNWTWDPVAGAFFWHRFYSHQPDLNFDNPRVLEEVLRVMKFWLDMGVDGLRLDAIPYLVERDGTNNENLPETHEVLRKIRAALDERYADRMLLAEANQWPEDTRPYFGNGDECHMAFHFPLMPRMYMAVAQEDRHPVTDIIRQTPDIPENCQWAIFLRNHDELTLEMVTEIERDYLWQAYAGDARARINLGIRRRLAPLMQNDRRKIELMNGLLLSMPGTPIIYYGDEIGMGDNYYLGDRDGVRTPMQWSTDRNAGFSRANPQQLYLPPIMDPIFGYQAINVEAQQSDGSSLLNWMKRTIAVRKQFAAFGRGNISFLYPRNRKILAYVRQHHDETILCVFNLARSAQAVELDLSAYRGCVPLELMGRATFPPIGNLPYLLTLPGYGFYWFFLANEDNSPAWHQPAPEGLPEFVTLTTPDGRIETILTGRERVQLERDTLPKFLPLQRWFGAKDKAIKSVAAKLLCSMSAADSAMVIIDVATDGEAQRYFLPLKVRWGEENLKVGAPKLSYTLAKVRRGAKVGALIDGAYDESCTGAILEAMKSGFALSGEFGSIRTTGSDALSGLTIEGESRPIGVEQSNVSVVFSDQVILKLYRRLRVGEQPDVEVSRFLTQKAGFTSTPALLGTLEHVDPAGELTTLAAAFAFVPNQGDAWGVVTAALEKHIEDYALLAKSGAEQLPEFGFPLDLGALLGQRTAELHAAFATKTGDPAFAVEPLTKKQLKDWSKAAVVEAQAVWAKLKAGATAMNEDAKPAVETLLSRREEIMRWLKAPAASTASGFLSRIHGDYHLGQVLVAKNDLLIIDFEGEPKRSLGERRSKSCVLRDVAGMLRSFDYARMTALAEHEKRAGADEIAGRRAAEWLRHTSTAFLDAYRESMKDCALCSDLALADALIDFFSIWKAVYEVDYELSNRPAWLGIPVRGILAILDRGKDAP